MDTFQLKSYLPQKDNTTVGQIRKAIEEKLVNAGDIQLNQVSAVQHSATTSAIHVQHSATQVQAGAAVQCDGMQTISATTPHSALQPGALPLSATPQSDPGASLCTSPHAAPHNNTQTISSQNAVPHSAPGHSAALSALATQTHTHWPHPQYPV